MIIIPKTPKCQQNFYGMIKFNILKRMTQLTSIKSWWLSNQLAGNFIKLNFFKKIPIYFLITDSWLNDLKIVHLLLHSPIAENFPFCFTSKIFPSPSSNCFISFSLRSDSLQTTFSMYSESVSDFSTVSPLHPKI